MKLLIEFTLDETWDGYEDVIPELIAEDMFIQLKDGVTYEVKKVKP